MGAKLLLDSPAKNPALGYRGIASAFAAIIESSEPRFAIGIFGDWGSGKTTLMDAIEGALSPATTIVVRFNAWRFEREQELLVPLLDTIRAALVRWADAHEPAAEAGQPEGGARKAARRIGKVVRALLAGVSLEVGLAPAAKVSYDVGTALAEFQPSDLPVEAQPQSLYFAGFEELSAALGEFEKSGVARIVVFVDDLDRCLPANALEVLEAMKLFFDLPGFVFVLGLDEEIVERAVRSRFADVVGTRAQVQAADRPAAGAPARTGARTGGEYVRKLFQVPYALPPMLPEQLNDLLEAMYGEAALDHEQLDDLRQRVRNYLVYVARDGRINPREVKRFINAYTIQTLVRPELDRDIVLALQTIAFRPEWEVAYDVLLSDSERFKEAVTSHRDGAAGALQAIWPRGATVPSEFADYAQSPELGPLVEADSLEPYLFSLQSTRSTIPWLRDAYSAVGDIRRRASLIRGGSQSRNDLADLGVEIIDRVRRLTDQMTDPDAPPSSIRTLLDTMLTQAETLTSQGPPTIEPAELERIADALDEGAARLQEELRAVRRRSLLQPAA